MRDAAKEFAVDSGRLASCHLVDIITEHAPAQPAELPSIWKPVSQRPTMKDASELGYVQVRFPLGPTIEYRHISECENWAKTAYWCRTADLLARCPLPKVKTQEELDEEWMETIAGNRPWSEEVRNMVASAIAHGRATANTEGAK